MIVIIIINGTKSVRTSTEHNSFHWICYLLLPLYGEEDLLYIAIVFFEHKVYMFILHIEL